MTPEQIELFGSVTSHSRVPSRVTIDSLPDPASPKIRSADCVTIYSRDHFYVGLDTGERAGKTVAFDGQSHIAYVDPVEAVSDPRWQAGTVIVFENTACSFAPSKRRRFDAVMRERSLVLYPVNPRNTKNRRFDWYPEIHKTLREQMDELDAEVLWRIGREGVIPKAPWDVEYRRGLSKHLLIRLRQVGYDLSHDSVPDSFRRAVASVLSRPAPRCAVVCGAAERSCLWTVDYKLLTAVYVATEATSWRKAKTIMRLRSVVRSNLMHHPLKRKSRDERKAIMRAQADLIRWVQAELAQRQMEAA